MHNIGGIQPGPFIGPGNGAWDRGIGEYGRVDSRITMCNNSYSRTEQQIRGLEWQIGALPPDSHQMSDIQTESARNVLLSTVFTLGVTGLETAFQALQYRLGNGQGVDKTVLATRSLALGIAVGDCAAALVDYVGKRYGFQGLQYGGDVVKSTLSWMAEQCGFSSEQSEQVTGAVSIGLRVGITLKHLHSGNLNNAVANTATMRILSLGKSVVAHELNTLSMVAVRTVDALKLQRGAQPYVLGANEIQEYRDEFRLMEGVQAGLHVLGEVGLPGGQLVAKVVGGVKAGMDFVEAQAFQPQLLADKLGITGAVPGENLMNTENSQVLVDDPLSVEPAAVSAWQTEADRMLASGEGEAWYQRGQTSLAAGNYESALAHFGMLVLMAPEIMPYQLACASVLDAMGEPAQAIPFYRRVVEENITNHDANCALAACLVKAVEYAQAEACLSSTIAQGDQGKMRELAAEVLSETLH